MEIYFLEQEIKKQHEILFRLFTNKEREVCIQIIKMLRDKLEIVKNREFNRSMYLNRTR